MDKLNLEARQPLKIKWSLKGEAKCDCVCDIVRKMDICLGIVYPYLDVSCSKYISDKIKSKS